MMKICHMTSVHPRYDTRIYQKQLKSLRKLDAELYLIVADGKGDERTNDGIQILDVGKPEGRLKRFLSSGKMVLRKALEVDADIYQFHDPELLRIGKTLIKKGKKVIYDSHEDVPRQILSKPYLKSFTKPMISKLFERFENRKASKLSHVITATDFIADRFLKILPNVTSIKNFPITDELYLEADWSVKEDKSCYIGAIAVTRGIREIAAAMSYTQYTFDLAGKFSSQSLEEEVLNHEAAGKINFYGFADRALVKKILSESKVGLVTLHPTISYQDALPVKMFEYMLAGIPVVTSNIPLWESIVQDADCGIAVDPFNPKEIAEAIDALISDDEKAERLGKNGQRAVLEKYNWKNEEKKLLSVYTELLTK